MAETTAGEPGGKWRPRVRGMLRRRWILVVVGVVAVVVVAAFLLNRAGGDDVFSVLDGSLDDLTYLAVFLLIFGDAVFPVLPGETTLNAASTLAAQGVLEIGLVMVAGAAGAVLGDSTLYWIARGATDRVKPHLDKARENPKVRVALDFLGESAPTLLVIGRYVPGLRFVVNSTLGLEKYPYRKFVVWSALGGTLWAIYTCALAYLVGTALAGFPLASIVISGVITTVALGAGYLLIRRQRRRAQQDAPAIPSG
ncbi:MAG TPA: DedA family protein [Miltoncostaeaceae bacterium]|nr:DedA family protein [Miltoncostaeaceae bacterium]